MKTRTGIISLSLITIILAMAAITQAEQLYDRGSDTMFQVWVCDPNLHMGTVEAGADLRKGSGGTHDISGYKILFFWPTTDGTVTLNGDSNKTMPVYGSQLNVMAISKNTTRMVLSVGGPLCGSD